MFNRFLKLFTLRRKNEKLKVLFDMDNVISDFASTVIPRLNERFGKSYKVEDIISWDLTKYYGADVFSVLNEEGLFLGFKPKNDALTEFPKIYNDARFDVWIVTSCGSTNEYAEKVVWMKKYFPDFPISRLIPCSEKDTIWADMLIDDGLHNLTSYEYVGEPVVYDMPHNRKFEDGKVVTYKRLHSMSGVRKYLEYRLKEKRNTKVA